MSIQSRYVEYCVGIQSRYVEYCVGIQSRYVEYCMCLCSFMWNTVCYVPVFVLQVSFIRNCEIW